MKYKLSLTFDSIDKPDEDKIKNAVLQAVNNIGIKSDDCNIMVDYHKELNDMSRDKQRALGLLHLRMQNYIVSIADSANFEAISDKITFTEFEMQKIWGFELNRNYHTHWLRPRCCSCPKTENKLLFGKGYIIDSNCKIHKHQIGYDFKDMIEKVKNKDILSELIKEF